MKYLTTLTAVTLAMCMSGTLCSCKSEKGTEAETTTEAIIARNETVTTAETESASESESETTSETSSTTTTAVTTTTASETETTTTAAKETTTAKASIKPTAATAKAVQAVTQAVPLSNTVATETATETRRETVPASTPAREVKPMVFVPVAVQNDAPVATVQGAGEEPFEVSADAAYCLADFDNSGEYLDHSFWAGNKYVLDYDLPYSYEIKDDGLVYFQNAEGEETFVLAYSDFVLICNCVAHEYGNAYYVPMYERSLVAEVIMNRYWNWNVDSIYNTVTARGAFSGSSSYADLPYLLGTADESVTGAVAMYFCNYNNPDYYNEGYLYFNGDGVWNHFRCTY